MARVTYETEAAEATGALPQHVLKRLERIVKRLEKWPDVSGAKSLSGNLAGHWRIRTGDYRVQFRVQGDEVIIERVGHRDRFYD